MTIKAKVSGKPTPVSGKIQKVVPKSAKPMFTHNSHPVSADLNREHKSTAAPPGVTSGSNGKEGERNTRDYSKLKIPDIKGLLKNRGIQYGKVNKSKLIELLQKDDAQQAKRDETRNNYAKQTVVQLKEQHKALKLPFKANTKKAELIKALEDADTSDVSGKGQVVKALKQEEPLPGTQNLSIPTKSLEKTIQAQPTRTKSATMRKILPQIVSAVQGLQVDVDRYSILPKSYKVFVRPATHLNPDIVYDAQLTHTDKDDNSTKFCHLQVLEDKPNNSYLTLIHWGRITGKKGSLRYFDGNSLKAAVSYFEKKFKEKTGLMWDDKDKSPMNNRYRFVKHEDALVQVTKDETFKGGHIEFGSQDESSDHDNDDSDSNYCTESDGDGSDRDSEIEYFSESEITPTPSDVASSIDKETPLPRRSARLEKRRKVASQSNSQL